MTDAVRHYRLSREVPDAAGCVRRWRLRPGRAIPAGSVLNGELGQEDFDTMKAALAKDIQEIQAAQRALTADAETFLHLTADTTR